MSMRPRQRTPDAGSGRRCRRISKQLDHVFWDGKLNRAASRRRLVNGSRPKPGVDAQVSVTAGSRAPVLELRGGGGLEVARRNADNQRETLRVAAVAARRMRHPTRCVARTGAIVGDAGDDCRIFEESVTRSILRLGVLIGKSPETLLADLGAPRACPRFPRRRAFGTPEALLRRQPTYRRTRPRRGDCAHWRRRRRRVPPWPRCGHWGFDALRTAAVGAMEAAKTWSLDPASNGPHSMSIQGEAAHR